MKLSRTAALACLALLALGAAFVSFDPAAPAATGRAGASLPAGHPLAAAAPARMDANALTASAAIAELQRQVAQLQAETAELRLRLPGTATAGTAVAAAAPVPGGRVAQRPNAPPDAADLEEADRALAETREAAFRNETLDSRWSVSTAGAIQQALVAGSGAAPAVRSLECRSRTCRVEIGASDSAQMDNLMPELSSRIAGTLASITASTIDAGDGSRSTVLYLSR